MDTNDYKWLENLVQLKIAEWSSREDDFDGLSIETALPGAYLLVHPVTREIYAGSTGHLYNRRYNHLWRIKQGNHRNWRVREAFLRNPTDVVHFFFWVTGTRADAYELEQKFLDAYIGHPKSLNIASDAVVAGRGVRRSAEFRELIRQKSLEIWQRPGHRELKSELAKQYASDPEVRKRLAEQSRTALQNPHVIETLRNKANQQWSDPEARRKKSEEVKAKHQDPGYRAKFMAGRLALSRKVSIDGKVYLSRRAAAEALGITIATVMGRIQSPHRPTWFYLEDENDGK